jgi:hypothetical protein
MGELMFSDATTAEVQRLTSILRKPVLPAQVWVLEGSCGRCVVVAASVIVREHFGDIFESPFSG